MCTILLFGAAANSQTNSTPSTGAPATIQELQNVIDDYAKSVDSFDLTLARKVWSTAPKYAGPAGASES